MDKSEPAIQGPKTLHQAATTALVRIQGRLANKPTDAERIYASGTADQEQFGAFAKPPRGNTTNVLSVVQQVQEMGMADELRTDIDEASADVQKLTNDVGALLKEVQNMPRKRSLEFSTRTEEQSNPPEKRARQNLSVRDYVSNLSAAPRELRQANMNHAQYVRPELLPEAYDSCLPGSVQHNQQLTTRTPILRNMELAGDLLRLAPATSLGRPGNLLGVLNLNPPGNHYLSRAEPYQPRQTVGGEAEAQAQDEDGHTSDLASESNASTVKGPVQRRGRPASSRAKKTLNQPETFPSYIWVPDDQEGIYRPVEDLPKNVWDRVWQMFMDLCGNRKTRKTRYCRITRNPATHDDQRCNNCVCSLTIGHSSTSATWTRSNDDTRFACDSCLKQGRPCVRLRKLDRILPPEAAPDGYALCLVPPTRNERLSQAWDRFEFWVNLEDPNNEDDLEDPNEDDIAGV